MISTTAISQGDLAQIYSLLQQAVKSSDSESQKQVYNRLSSAEEQPSFFIGLVTLAYNSGIDAQIREMALLTLKSALKRNEMVVTFTEDQFDYLRNTIIAAKHHKGRVIQNASKSLLSILALWCRQVNFQILRYLLQEIGGDDGANASWGLQTLKIILEDIKFDTENISCFSKPQFSHFLQQYTEIFGAKIKSAPLELTQKYLAIMNLLLKYTYHVPDLQILKQYLDQFLLPALSNSALPDSLMETVLEGLTEVTQINCVVILSSNSALQLIIGFNSPAAEMTKKWLSLVYDIIIKDSQEKLKPYLGTLLQKVTQNLVFTKEDQINVRLEMEEENNPYQYELQEQDDDDDQLYGDHNNLSGYTCRKLSVMIFKQLFTIHTEEVWGLCSPYLEKLAVAENLLQRQCGILMIGLIYEISEDYLDLLSKVVPLIVQNINTDTLPDILRCTSLWALAKMSYIITREQSVSDQIQRELIKCLSQNSKASGQVQDTAYTTLDEFVRCSQETPKNINEVIMCVVNGVRNCQVKTLYPVLKICSTLYERYSSGIPNEATDAILKELCRKWSQNNKIQSIMSPILECLVTISSANTTAFKLYACEVFDQAYKILENEHQKTVVLRSIDLLSSIISTNNPQINQILAQNPHVHQKFLDLLCSDENQVVNFTYGLLGDIAKVIQIPKYAEIYIQSIGSKLNPNNLTSCSNALTCLTDLIVAHPYLASKYGKDVAALAISKININNLQPIYGFNFARAYCRLANCCAAHCAEFLPDNLKQISIFLRAQEHQKLTDEAYKGLFNLITQYPQTAIKHFGHLVQSFLCYPCQDKEVSACFLNLLKSYRSSLNPEEWDRFLKNPIFLPAMSKKIDTISSPL